MYIYSKSAKIKNLKLFPFLFHLAVNLKGNFIFMEVWKDIKGYEGYYQVSNLGKVKRLAKKVLQSNGSLAIYRERVLKEENTKGYLRVTLSRGNKQKRFLIHRLVATHFILNINKKRFVNHIDGNKENNKFINLEWCTSSENEIHSYSVLGKVNFNRKLKELDIIFIKTNAVKGRNGNIKKLSDKFKVDVSTIYNVLKNKYYV